MTYEEGVKQVADELRTNRNGAYGLAVRLAAENGGKPDQLMTDALSYNKKNIGHAQSDRPALVEVDFPTAEAMEVQVLEQAEALGGLGPDSLVLVPLFMALLVEERQRFLQMLGK